MKMHTFQKKRLKKWAFRKLLIPNDIFVSKLSEMNNNRAQKKLRLDWYARAKFSTELIISVDKKESRKIMRFEA